MVGEHFLSYHFLSPCRFAALAAQPRDPSRECIDQPELANCDLILQAQLCGNEYYSSFCCASCSRFQPHAQPIWQQGWRLAPAPILKQLVGLGRRQDRFLVTPLWLSERVIFWRQWPFHTHPTPTQCLATAAAASLCSPQQCLHLWHNHRWLLSCQEEESVWIRTPYTF